MESLRRALSTYQQNWLADSSKTAKMSQWRIYLRFCDEMELVALPAEMDTILLYLAYLAETRSYVTIINYLSGVWLLHKVNGIQHLDPSSFPIVMTLRGIRRVLGDSKNQARPITVYELRLIFTKLDMSDSQDVAFWLGVLLCFRGLLRKSNIVEQGLAVSLSDLTFEDWGVVLSVHRTKTISFKERVLVIPFNSLPCSIFCVQRFVSLLLSMVHFPSRNSQLISYMIGSRFVRGTYTWFSKKLSGLCDNLQLEHVSSHSLRRGGASALGDAKFTLLQVKDMGDWNSLSVLQYVTKTMDAKRSLDKDMCAKVFGAGTDF